MGRERCFFCDRFIFDGEDVTRPPSLGLTVHRHCYLHDAGLDSNLHGGLQSHERADEDDDVDERAS